MVYALSGNTITRTENGVLTTIASSTDNLVPETTDVQQANTEYTTTNVTFQPILTSGDDRPRNRAGNAAEQLFMPPHTCDNSRRGN